MRRFIGGYIVLDIDRAQANHWDGCGRGGREKTGYESFFVEVVTPEYV